MIHGQKTIILTWRPAICRYHGQRDATLVTLRQQRMASVSDQFTASEAGYVVVSCYVSIWPSHQIADKVTAWASLDVQRDTCTKVHSFRLIIPDAVSPRVVQSWSAGCFLRVFVIVLKMAWTQESQNIIRTVQEKRNTGPIAPIAL